MKISIFKLSTNSLFSFKFSVISFKSFTQSMSCAILLPFSLYSKCAATQISACLCICPVLICISVGCFENFLKSQIIVV